jgi:hypothetical protein
MDFFMNIDLNVLSKDRIICRSLVSWLRVPGFCFLIEGDTRLIMILGPTTVLCGGGVHSRLEGLGGIRVNIDSGKVVCLSAVSSRADLSVSR